MIRPQTFPSKGDEDSPECEGFKKLNESGQDSDAVIVFQDKVHFMAESAVTCQWYEKGSRSKVKSYPGRKSVAYSGFVIPETDELYVAKPDWFNYETTIDCIRQFISGHKMPAGKRLYIIMDNAPWHKKCKRLIGDDEQYSDIRAVAAIIPLPPYSPDLNPIEQVWRITRRVKTHNRFW